MDATDLDRMLQQFLGATAFPERGAVMTDLDGTALHEVEGRLAIPKTVSHGLQAVHSLGVPVVLNTLRFPLNVIATFGREWYDVTSAALPLISLNGSVAGHLVETPTGTIGFETLWATPLAEPTWRALVDELRDRADAGHADVAVFHYSARWEDGERIWTADAQRVPALAARYPSAAGVSAEPIAALAERWSKQPPVMVLTVALETGDTRMAYQHVRPNEFLTASGVDKASGARQLAERLGFDLDAAVGAGDTPMDRFLDEVGLSLHVGPLDLSFRGRHATVRVPDSLALGEVWFRLADRIRATHGAG